MKELHELERMLSARLGHDKRLFILSCASEFEPYGRASETWEIIWCLTIPGIGWHWKNNRGKWQQGTKAAPMQFEARMPEAAVAAAIAFMRETEPAATAGEGK